MTGALWAKRGERDISRGARSARRGEDKNKPPFRSPLFLLFRPLIRSQILTTRVMSKEPIKTRTIIYGIFVQDDSSLAVVQ